MAKEDKKQAVAKKGETALPAFMQNQAGRGLETLNSGDYEIPRIKVLDALSAEVTEGRGKVGEFWHTVLEESIEGPVVCTPLFVSKSYILWKPREDGGGILARADDAINWQPPAGKFEVKIDKKGTKVTWELKPTVAESRLDQWGTFDPSDPKSPPAATYMLNAALWLHDYPELSPVVLTFQRGRLSQGRKFTGKLKLSNAPIYGRVFNMVSFGDQNNAGDDFQNVRMEAAGLVQNEKDFKKFEEGYNLFASMGLKVKDIEGLQSDNAGAEGSGDGAGKAPTEEEMKGRGQRAY